MASAHTMRAVRFIRKLRGGSQPILVQAEDDQLYVVKFLDNPQGPQVLTNEVLGTEAYRMAGLPVPSWETIRLTDRFIDANPGCWIDSGRRYIRLHSGPCFGSRYLGASFYEKVWDLLTDDILSVLANRTDFWTAAALDAMMDETDSRQAVFVRREQAYQAFFVDHGGGCTGAPTTNLGGNWFERVRFYDRRVYPIVTPEIVDNLFASMNRIRADALREAFCELPIPWKLTGGIRYLQIMKNISDSSWIPMVNQSGLLSLKLRGMNDKHDSIWKSKREGVPPKIPAAKFCAHL